MYGKITDLREENVVMTVDGWPGVKKDQTLARVYTIHPNNTDTTLRILNKILPNYLRLLLHEIRDPTSFIELKTVNGTIQPTYQSACKVLGLLEDDRHWNATMVEAALCESPFRLRKIFAVMLMFCQLPDASNLWEKYKDTLSEDIWHQVELELQHRDVHLILNEVYNKCLVCLEDTVLSLGGQCLQQYGLSQPSRCNEVLQNTDYLQEMSYDSNILAQIVTTNENLLNNEQSHVYSQILESIKKSTGQTFFLDTPGGTSKTFVLSLLLARMRKDCQRALAVASSGIAATLLEGGRTAHSAFKLPLNLMQVETPICNISKQSNMAQVLKDCKLIV
ncbi:uncharacterized protein LOC111631274 [Centruroides sculpturatus]|uniref:uncharacterized protein LOC111631274 n=1 Tax=Centruroides sculpturatus TaxID=218467 RepID=UPI000C6DF1FD|nr:uncharacterized protein LOC111631274 [Centruroides sculpturatus]